MNNYRVFFFAPQEGNIFMDLLAKTAADAEDTITVACGYGTKVFAVEEHTADHKPSDTPTQ